MRARDLLYFTLMNQYEIKYKHGDMSKEYVGTTVKWARDEKQAIGFICSNKPDKLMRCSSKKNAFLQIISIKCI